MIILNKFFSFFSLSFVLFSLSDFSDAFAIERKDNPVIRLGITNNIFVSEKSSEKKLRDEVFLVFNSILNNNSFYKLTNLKEIPVTDILTSDEIIKIGKTNNVDIIMAASVIKFNADIILTVRLMDTVAGKVIFSKEYLVKQNEISKIKEIISNDLMLFAKDIENSAINIFDSNKGNSEIKINSVPTSAKVAFDGNEIGKTPLIIRNVSNTQHLIETWQEEKAVIKNLNISAVDEKIFQLKFENKTYTETVVKLFDLEDYDYEFEIMANPDEKERPKLSDLKYDTRNFKVEVVTDSENAQIIIDGKPAGSSPLMLNNLLPGKHKISLSRKKLFVFRQLVDSFNNKISYVDFNLYKLGRALISSLPQGADILIEGEKIGVTPKSIDLPLGRHSIEIKKDGFNSEIYSLNVNEGRTNELNATLTSLRNFDNNVAYIPTASVDNTLGVSAFTMTLGQYYSDEVNSKSIVYLYGTEVNYGFKNLFSFGKYINLSTQFGAFFNHLATFSQDKNFPTNQGLGLKVQFINQNDFIPVSAAIGAFYNVNSNWEQKANFYVAASRDFGFLSAHLGVTAQPFKLSAINLNINYNRFYRIKIGASVLIDFNMLATGKGEHITPLLGLTFGYNFL